MGKRGMAFVLSAGLIVFAGIGLVPLAAETELLDSGIRIIPLPEVELPEQVCVDQGRVYIVDKRNILVYDLESGRLRTTIGKIGQGPGEFMMGPRGLAVFPGRLVARDIQRIEFFSLEGEYAGEIRTPESMGIYPFLPVGKNFIGFPFEINKDGSGVTAAGLIYDRDVKPVKEFYGKFLVQGPPPPPPPGSGPPAGKTDVKMIVDYIDYLVSDNKIYVADSRNGLSISVFDENGGFLREIRLPIDKVKVPKSYIEDVIKQRKASKYWKTVLAYQNTIFPEAFPAFVGFKVDGGRIYVLTAAQKDGLYEVIVLDLEGRVLGKSFRFPVRPNFHTPQTFGADYDIEGDKIFWLVYNETKEIYELHTR